MHLNVEDVTLHRIQQYLSVGRPVMIKRFASNERERTVIISRLSVPEDVSLGGLNNELKDLADPSKIEIQRVKTKGIKAMQCI